MRQQGTKPTEWTFRWGLCVAAMLATSTAMARYHSLQTPTNQSAEHAVTREALTLPASLPSTDKPSIEGEILVRARGGDWLTGSPELGLAGAVVATLLLVTYGLKKRQDLPPEDTLKWVAVVVLACGVTFLAEPLANWWPASQWATDCLKWGAAVGAWCGAVLLIRHMASPRLWNSVTSLTNGTPATREFLNRALEAGEFGVWEFDIASGSLKCDEQTRRLFDLPEAADAPIDYQELRARIHPEDRKRIRRLVVASVTGDRPFRADFRLRENDWLETHVRAHAELVLDHQGEPASLVGISLDISESRQNEKVFQETSALNRSILDTAADGIITIDGCGIIQVCNLAATQMFGYTENELVGHNVNMLMPMPHRDYHDRYLATYQKTNCKRIIGSTRELSARRKDGSEFPIELSISEVKVGDATLFTGIVRDITERKEYRDRLELAKEEAELANKAKSLFLASMSHELRTPLNGVIGMTELLQHTPLDKRQQRFVKACRTNAMGLTSLVNNVLDYSKIESGGLELDEHPFDLLDLLDEAVCSMSPLLDGTEVTLCRSINTRTSIALRADRARIQQVLFNLLGNAIKFTKRGSIHCQAIVESITEDVARIRFSVTDTGIGIPEEKLDRLFKEFSQVDRSINRKYGGTGLGLAICRNLVEAMGGNIGVLSTEGKGSEFWFRLAIPLATTAEVAEEQPVESLQGVRVGLVVDDEEYRTYASRCLEAHRMTVQMHLSEDGGRNCDLVICDRTGYQYLLTTAEKRDLQRVLLIGSDVETPSCMKVIPLIDTPLGQVNLTENVARVVREISVDEPFLFESTYAQDGDQHPSRKILVVDDNETNQLFTSEALLRLGWQCDIAGNGEEALAMSFAVGYDAILMDCQMPAMDGYEATMRLRDREAQLGLPPVPIIALTANAMQGDIELCHASGMDCYLAKPFTIEDLRQVLREALDKLQPGRPSPSPPTLSKDPIELDDSPICRQAILARCAGDQQFASDMLTSFVRDVPMRLTEVLEATQQRDFDAARQAAHSLKGIAGVACADAVRAVACDVEAAIRTRETRLLTDLLVKLQEEVHASIDCAKRLQEELLSVDEMIHPEIQSSSAVG